MDLKNIKTRLALLFVITCFSPSVSRAIGGKTYVSAHKSSGCFTLYGGGVPAPLYISHSDYPGVIRALHDLKTDIGKVVQKEPLLLYEARPSQKEIIIAGTVGRSELIDTLVKQGKLNINVIKGKWENFLIQTVESPFPGVERALVIAGSDKRGTIYGIYDLSEQIGVSPWYWWADVPVQHKNNLYINPVKLIEAPSVQYRGIFINDEAPDLTNWVREKYGTVKPGEDPPVGRGVANYNHEFYARIFELLLRIKANYLWPAMWSNAFNEDDPENPSLADEYGIVMGTSHQEPMLRSQQEWDRRYFKRLGHWNYLTQADTLLHFWREGIRRNKHFESIVTMGLRGANDSEMGGTITDNISMVEKIVQTQQQIIREEMGESGTRVPQVWCLYKEIMEYYNEGMRVPDNITLLWADDNWGNIRRLPDSSERKRAGGAGVYYHFDYHGDPRSYEWINTNPLPKIWDQLHLAKEYGADKIWVVNVGHFRGYELPMEYFMSLAWNTQTWKNDNITMFTRLWAAREFGKIYSADIAGILSSYTKFNGRCKPESLTPGTYSNINYNEADNIVTDFERIVRRAEFIYNKLPGSLHDAFYQMVLFPVKASALVNELYVTAGKNELYAYQRRASTNVMAAKVRALFNADTSLMAYYNHVYANGRWNHFMDESHIGYTNWAPPNKNNLDAISLKEITVLATAEMGVGIEGCNEGWPGTGGEAVLPVFDAYSNRRHYIDVFNRGKDSFRFQVKANVPWLKLDVTDGNITDKDKRIWVSFNEAAFAGDNSAGTITVTGGGEKILIQVTGFVPGNRGNEPVKGFIESGGVISIEAGHYTSNTAEGIRQWIKIEDYGLTGSGMRATGPANAPAATPLQNAPCLTYPVHLFSADTAEITLVTSPLLNFMPERDIRLAIAFDNDPPVLITNVPDKFKVHWSNPAWAQTVVRQARHCQAKLKISRPGNHVFKVWMVDPGVVLEKILINTGGLKASRLGPPESYVLQAPSTTR